VSKIEAERVELTAEDGLRLIAYSFENQSPRAAIMISCATAVRQQFYFPFARWLHTQGYSVLTFDYRGLGESLDAASVKESPARKQDWGELDMPAALGWLDDKYPEIKKHLVGHSAGGLLFGLMPNYKKLASIVSVGCSTGNVYKTKMPDRIALSLMLALYFPLAIKTFGYLPAKKMKLGEDLPAGVARQWAHWCSNPGYVSNAFGKDIKAHHFDEVCAPMVVLNMKDDPIASDANVDALHKLFPRIKLNKVTLDPKAYGLGQVGHMGFFKNSNSALWPNVTEWLDKMEKS
jgi:predicted alpha/beta hydrolase